MNPTKPYRSFFWPMILIGVGVIWLLANLKIIPAVNVNMLINFWPLILIVIGLDILVGRNSPVIGALIGLGAVALVILGLIFGQAIGLAKPAETLTERFFEPVGQATSAYVNLKFASEPVSVNALSDSANLIDATLVHYGKIDFRASGTTEKNITLSKIFTTNEIFTGFWDPQVKWTIGLSPKVPMELTIDGASGSIDMDLSGLQLTKFSADTGSGSIDLTLPSGTAYTASVSSGSGSVNIRLLDKTSVTLKLNSGSGSVNISLPRNAAVRVEVRSSGSGSVNVDGMNKVSGGSGEKEGVWETSNYASADMKIVIIADDLGSGSFNVR
jgi:hypothetical protein